MVCACGDQFSVEHAMVCQHGGFIIQRLNELHDLEAEMLRMVCKDVEDEPVLQEKRQFAARVMEIEQGTLTPLVFTTTGGMAMYVLSTAADLWN